MELGIGAVALYTYTASPAGQQVIRNGVSAIAGAFSHLFSKGEETAQTAPTATPAAPVGATPLPANPSDLTEQGYTETSHPDASVAGIAHLKTLRLGIRCGMIKESLEPLATKDQIIIIVTIRTRLAKAISISMRTENQFHVAPMLRI